jgi:hypothetical protein
VIEDLSRFELLLKKEALNGRKNINTSDALRLLRRETHLVEALMTLVDEETFNKAKEIAIERRAAFNRAKKEQKARNMERQRALGYIK